MNNIIEIAETCESCARPHRWNGNKRTGVCEYLEGKGANGQTTRFGICRFYLRDMKKYQELTKEIK